LKKLKALGFELKGNEGKEKDMEFVVIAMKIKIKMSLIFCSPWFLTCFSLSAQHDKDSQTLRQVWDILLSEKWIGFYKVSLVLLKLNEKDIMNYSYEDIM